jgi:hypothetical protein
LNNCKDLFDGERLIGRARVHEPILRQNVQKHACVRAEA